MPTFAYPTYVGYDKWHQHYLDAADLNTDFYSFQPMSTEEISLEGSPDFIIDSDQDNDIITNFWFQKANSLHKSQSTTIKGKALAFHRAWK